MSNKLAALPTESELRLAISDKWINRLKRLPLLVKSADERAKTTQLKSIYFDTPDKRLAAADMSLRIREIGRRKLQTLKIGGGWQAGITERIELEGWVNGDEPTLDLIHAPDIRELLIKNRLWDRLQPSFVTSFRRTSRIIKYDGRFGDACIAADLDIGEIRSGTRKTAICELELELKDGQPTHFSSWQVLLRIYRPR